MPSQEAEQLPEIETYGCQQCVAAISGAALQPVAAQQPIVFRMPDYRFDHRAAFQPTFDFIGDASSLPGEEDLRVWMTGEPVPFISLVHRDAQRAAAHDFPHIVQRLLQRVTIVGIAVQRTRLQDEVPALGRMQIRGDGNFAAEFVRRARLALADAFGFRRVPGVNVISSPRCWCAMRQARPSLVQPLDGRFRQRGQRRHFATHVADQPPQTHPQKFHLPLGASLLLRV